MWGRGGLTGRAGGREGWLPGGWLGVVGWYRLGRAKLVGSVTPRTTVLGGLADKVAAGNRPKSPELSRPRKAPPRSVKGGG